MYTTTHTRPYASFHVAFLSRFMAHPSKQVYAATKQVIRYLLSKVEEKLCYQKSEEGESFVFKIYVDAGLQCETTRRWTSGFILYLNGNPIHWVSKRQCLVALSTCEAELIALCQATVDTICIRNILMQLKLIGKSATQVFCDKQSGIALVTSNFIKSTRSKHIDIKYNFAREQQRQFETIDVDEGELCGWLQVQSTTISNIMVALHETESVDIDISDTLNQSGLMLHHLEEEATST